MYGKGDLGRKSTPPIAFVYSCAVVKCAMRWARAQAVVVTKPASIPVHHCGQYRKNTVVGLLAALHGITDVKPLHRLDRPVSGASSLNRACNRKHLSISFTPATLQ